LGIIKRDMRRPEHKENYMAKKDFFFGSLDTEGL
jgi:hypothetical protein